MIPPHWNSWKTRLHDYVLGFGIALFILAFVFPMCVVLLWDWLGPRKNPP